MLHLGYLYGTAEEQMRHPETHHYELVIPKI